MKIADAVVAASLVALVGCSETKAPPPAEAKADPTSGDDPSNGSADED